MFGKKTERVGNQTMKQDHPNYKSVKIGQNTEKCSGGLRRLVITPVKDH